MARRGGRRYECGCECRVSVGVDAGSADGCYESSGAAVTLVLQ